MTESPPLAALRDRLLEDFPGVSPDWIADLVVAGWESTSASASEDLRLAVTERHVRLILREDG